MAWLLYLALLILLVGGIALAAVNLPGLWLMLAAVCGYAWLTGWAYVGKWWLLVLLLVAIIAEVIDTFAAGAGAKRAGGSRRGTIGAILGGIIGGIFLSFLIPVPLLGTVIGICVGTFFGALAGELSGGRHVEHSLHIGVGATKGRLTGMLAKVAIGVVMAVLIVWRAFPVKAAASARGALPATRPITRGVR